jgi:uncharacterized protein YabN with tetrapyrrole methylase and pyrophosphatase domain
VDEFYCDKNAMKAEEQDALDGFLVNELSLELRKKKIIIEKVFSSYFNADVKKRLIAESDSDLEISTQKTLIPYVIPEVGLLADKSRNINSLTSISSCCSAQN